MILFFGGGYKMIKKNLTGKFVEKLNKIMIVVLCAIIIIIFVTAYLLTKQGNHIAENEIDKYLAELTYQTSYKVNQCTNTNLNALFNLSDELNIVDENDRQKLIDSATSHTPFSRIGYITADEKFENGKEQLDISNTNIISDIKNGNRNSISNKVIQFDNGLEGVLYAVASNNDNAIALGGFISNDDMPKYLNTDTYQGDGFAHIVNKDGDYIYKSQNKKAVLTNGNNFIEELLKLSTSKENKESILDMKDKLKEDIKGRITYTVKGGEERSLTYIPLDKGDWYLVSIVPSNTYVYDIEQFTSQSILAVAGISILLFSALLVAVYLSSVKKISDIEYVDPVTQGFTKSRFEQEIKEIITEYLPFAYVVLDIRKFKLINDLTGSNGGDAVLRHVYHCITKNLRPGEFAARLQADYFEIMLETIDKKSISKRLLEIAEDINSFNKYREIPYYLPIDCGIYIVEETTDDLVIIRDRANSARKNNKDTGRDHHLCSYIFYDDIVRLQMVQEKEIDNNMEKALEDEEFVVYLQPKVDVKTNKVVGAEALIRWNSPVLGFLSPDKFIPYFEKTGFIIQLDEYVFKKVCQQIRKWLDEGKEPVPVSVNLSRRDIFDKKYIRRYKKIQQHYAVPAHLLEIEFTETLFFENLELLKDAIKDVHEAGYLCSIDDFGSGYSSLGLLKEVPVDILKLDRVFFDDASNSRGDKVIEHIIALAKDLDMITIAEGIESLEQVDTLKQMNCDLIQGYVYYRPMCIDDFDKIVDNDYEIISI